MSVIKENGVLHISADDTEGLIAILNDEGEDIDDDLRAVGLEVIRNAQDRGRTDINELRFTIVDEPFNALQ